MNREKYYMLSCAASRVYDIIQAGNFSAHYYRDMEDGQRVYVVEWKL